MFILESVDGIVLLLALLAIGNGVISPAAQREFRSTRDRRADPVPMPASRAHSHVFSAANSAIMLSGVRRL